MAATASDIQELKNLIIGVDQKVTDFSGKLDKVEKQLTNMINEVKIDVNTLRTKYETSVVEVKDLRRDFNELERGVAAMDVQLHELENSKLEAQKTELETQIQSLTEKTILLEKHERKYNILIYGLDDSANDDENVYAVVRQFFNKDLDIDQRKVNSIPLANAHRVPTRGTGPEPIIVRFLHFGDKQLVMSRGFKLAGKKIRILDDLPVVMKEKRHKLARAAYDIRKREKLQTRIRDVGATLVLETRKSNGDRWCVRE